MPAPIWPPTTGFPLADGFRNTFGVQAERSSVDAGPAKQRRTSTGTPDQVQLVYLMTTAQRNWLEAFFKGSTGGRGGATWFEWTHPALQSVKLARFLAETPPSYQPYKPDWLVSVSLEWREP